MLGSTLLKSTKSYYPHDEFKTRATHVVLGCHDIFLGFFLSFFTNTYAIRL